MKPGRMMAMLPAITALGATGCAAVNEAERSPSPPSDAAPVSRSIDDDNISVVPYRFAYDSRTSCPHEARCASTPCDLGMLPDEAELREMDEERRYAWKLFAAGLATIAVGQGLALAYASATGHAADRGLDFLPVIGPIVLAVRDQPTGPWGSALAFSTFLQSAGVMVTAIAGMVLGDLRVQPSVSVSRGGASLDLGTRF